MSVDTFIPPAPPPPPLAWWERLMDRLIPDNKGWMTVAAVAVLLFILQMIREQPALLQNASFMQFAGVVGASSFALVLSHFFGGTKTGGDVMAANAKTVNASAAASNGSPAAGTTTTTTTTAAPTPVVVTNDPAAPVPVAEARDPFKIG